MTCEGVCDKKTARMDIDKATTRSICQIGIITGIRKRNLNDFLSTDSERKFGGGDFLQDALSRYVINTISHQRSAHSQQFATLTAPRSFWLERSVLKLRTIMKMRGDCKHPASHWSLATLWQPFHKNLQAFYSEYCKETEGKEWCSEMWRVGQ